MLKQLVDKQQAHLEDSVAMRIHDADTWATAVIQLTVSTLIKAQDNEHVLSFMIETSV